MKFCIKYISFILAAGMLSCAGGQLTPLEDHLSQIDRRIQTDRAETKAENDTLKLEISRLQERVAHLSKTQADLIIALDEFKSTVQRLTQTITDINSKLNKFRYSPAPPNISSTHSSSSSNTSNPILEQRPEHLYQTAYNDYVNKKYDLAIVEFREFIVSFPDSDLADNAQYWIGECFYAQGKLNEALAEFNRTLKKYPDSDKYVPALLKVGFCFLDMGDITSGEKTLESLINQFPFSEESRLAREKLKETH